MCRGHSPPRAKIKPSECESAVFPLKHGPDDFLSFQRSQHPEAAQEKQHPPPARLRWALGGGDGRDGRLLRGSSGVSEPPPPSPCQIQEEELPPSHPHPPPYPRCRLREQRLPAGLDPEFAPPVPPPLHVTPESRGSGPGRWEALFHLLESEASFRGRSSHLSIENLPVSPESPTSASAGAPQTGRSHRRCQRRSLRFQKKVGTPVQLHRFIKTVQSFCFCVTSQI